MKSIIVNRIKLFCTRIGTGCILSVWMLFIVPAGLYAQGQSDLASVLAQLPAKDAQEEKRLFGELVSLGEPGLGQLTKMIVPNGQAAGVAPRYAISLLSHTVTDETQKRMLEQMYLRGVEEANDPEVKAYFISHLKLVGSDASVAVLRALINNDALYDPAIGTLTVIGTESARQALLQSLEDRPARVQARLLQALADLRYVPAAKTAANLASANDPVVQRQALWALARIGDRSSSAVLLQHARQANFKADPTEATAALTEYLDNLTVQKNTEAVTVANAVLRETSDPSQQHLRLAAIKAIVTVNPASAVKLVVSESKRFGTEYQLEVLKLAGPTVAVGNKTWKKEFKSATGPRQAGILTLLNSVNKTEEQQRAFADQLIAALKSASMDTRVAAADLLAAGRNKNHIEPLLDYLMTSPDRRDIRAASTAIGQLASAGDGSAIAARLSSADDTHKIALAGLLASKRATQQLAAIKTLTGASGDSVRLAGYNALARVASPSDMGVLLSLLGETKNEDELKALQSALIATVDRSNSAQILAAYDNEPVKLTAVLPYIADKEALTKVQAAFAGSDGALKQAAFQALTSWTNDSAIRPLFNILKDPSLRSYHAAAGESILTSVVRSTLPDDQKLLLVREVMPYAANRQQKTAVLRAAGSIRTFLSFIFVSGYLDDPELGSIASRPAMNIALPASDGRPGLTGVEVRNVLKKMADKLTGADSQYEKIDILTYLETMPYVTGYESIFNGKNLSGWQGLVEDPIKRSKMTAAVLAKKQQEANAKISANWSVKDGMIVFQGDGANLCTTRRYGDFEMLVDWKISKNGDSGIYLRGSPQVQIWDTTRRDVGAQVGSGGLYNNQKGSSTPLTVADNPIGEWNTFRIRMVGERVWVHLNGVLVVDSVVLENYWDRNLPIFPEEAIELQAHGTDLAFRNIYVKEINPQPYRITTEEQKAGFQPLFNGKDLNNWVGNKTDYVVEGNTIALYPGEKSHGNLYTEKQYGNFTLRFEFQLTPGANNGLGIHAPLEGDAAYVGKEIQILDNTSPQYASLQPWQFHGSVYGILAAKRNFLKPVGEWNEQEVYVKGDFIRVTLNGTVIVEGDLKKATAKGTLDGKEHPGLQRRTGHIGFLGHGSVVRFKNLRINEPK